MGGTCAADLAVMHPELFDTLLDIAGDLGPAVGDQAQTIDQLYGGNAAAWAEFDPLTVLAGDPTYPDTAGWFANAAPGPGPPPAGRHGGNGHPARGPRRIPDTAAGPCSGDQSQEAIQLCAAMTADGITCTQHTTPGGHTWQVAATSFANAFGWLAGRVASLTGSSGQPRTLRYALV